MKSLRRTFALLTPDDLARLEASIVFRDYGVDEVILREGDRAQKLFLVITGRVRVEKTYLGAPIPVAELDNDELFGEMSFVENSGASASVVADQPSQIGIINAEQVNVLLQAEPAFASRFYHSLALLLSKRLRQTTQMILPGVMSG